MLQLYSGDVSESPPRTAFWLLNDSTIVTRIYTDVEWDALLRKPKNAQYVDGFWITLENVEQNNGGTQQASHHRCAAPSLYSQQQ